MSGNESINTVYENTYFGKYDFIHDAPGFAISCIVLLGLASVVGTFGNIMILIVVSKTKELRQTQSIFIVNLAISDMYVTLIADPMSIVGKIEGRHFFDEHSLLCQIVGKVCTISCISSLGSIMFLSFNRYVFICHNPYYNKLFSRRACIIMCVILYCIGLTLVLLNSAGVGDHSFDDKSLECIWDRMATYSYTVVFSVGLVWIPLLVVGISYISLFKFVLRKRKQIAAANNTNRPLKLARTIFIVYAVFSVCWIPFAVLIVADAEDTFPHEVHLFITVFAHLHPSMNWLIYYLTNGNFKLGFHKLLKINPSSIHVLQLNDSNLKCDPTSSPVNNSKPKLIASVNKKGTSSKI